MEYVHLKVVHDTFGEGVIVSQFPARIHVQFAGEKMPRIFQIQDLGHHLHLQNMPCTGSLPAALAARQTHAHGTGATDGMAAHADQQAVASISSRQGIPASSSFGHAPFPSASSMPGPSITSPSMSEPSIPSPSAVRQHSQTDPRVTRTGPAASAKPASDVAFATMDDFCTCMIEEIYKEYRKNASTPARYYILQNGNLIKEDDWGTYYHFHTGEYVDIPAGSKVTCDARGRILEATIVEASGYHVLLRTDSFLGRRPKELKMTNSPLFLLEQLMERMEDLQQDPGPIASNLVLHGKDHSSAALKTGQNTALEMALDPEQPILFIWGPPGTGKTTTLSRIAAEHLQQGKRILMVSYSNIAVDGALQKTADLIERLQPDLVYQHKLLRYGYPKEESLQEDPWLNPKHILLSQYPQLDQEEKKLETGRKGLKKNSPDYLQYTLELNRLQEKLGSMEKKMMEDAQFIATTAAKATSDPRIYEQTYDVVIFDEASMAYIPHIVFSASLATERFICIGDFKQLPPIVQNPRLHYLPRDIYQMCGISQAITQGKGHDWLCLLDVEYRYPQALAQFVSHAMYHDLLKAAPHLRSTASSVRADWLQDKVVQIIDTASLYPTASGTDRGSRINVLSAFLAVTIAESLDEHLSIGIISPYAHQARLMASIVRDVCLHRYGQDDPKAIPWNIICSTVHQFQGSERDVIILDLCDDPPCTKPGLPLMNQTHDAANRLLNVALTRTKQKCIILADLHFFTSQRVPYKSLLERLLQTYGPKAMDASALLHYLQQTRKTHNKTADSFCLQWQDLSRKTDLQLAPLEAPKVYANLMDAGSARGSWHILQALQKPVADAAAMLAIEEKRQESQSTQLQLQLETPEAFQAHPDHPDSAPENPTNPDKTTPAADPAPPFVSHPASQKKTSQHAEMANPPSAGTRKRSLSHTSSIQIRTTLCARMPAWALPYTRKTHWPFNTFLLLHQDLYLFANRQSGWMVHMKSRHAASFLKDLRQPLQGFLRHLRPEYTPRGEPVIHTFADWILHHSTCPKCHASMRLMQNYSSKAFYLACQDHEQHTLPLLEEMIQAYIQEAYGSIQCPRCGGSLHIVCANGSVIIQCTRHNHHRYDLLDL